MRNSHGKADTLTEELLHSGWFSREHSSLLKVQGKARRLKESGNSDEHWLKALEAAKEFGGKNLALTFHHLYPSRNAKLHEKVGEPGWFLKLGDRGHHALKPQELYV